MQSPRTTVDDGYIKLIPSYFCSSVNSSENSEAILAQRAGNGLITFQD